MHSEKDDEAAALYDRAQLDRRRLENAFIKYSILQSSKQYPEHFGDVPFSFTIEETLEEITPLYYQVFPRIHGYLTLHMNTGS